jgi:hypothetical protein
MRSDLRRVYNSFYAFGILAMSRGRGFCSGDSGRDRPQLDDEVVGFAEAARGKAAVLFVAEGDPLAHRLVQVRRQSALVCRGEGLAGHVRGLPGNERSRARDARGAAA